MVSWSGNATVHLSYYVAIIISVCNVRLLYFLLVPLHPSTHHKTQGTQKTFPCTATRKGWVPEHKCWLGSLISWIMMFKNRKYLKKKISLALLHCVKYFRIYYFYRPLKRKRAHFLNFNLKEIKIDLFPCSNLEIKIKNIMLACHFVFQIFGQRKYFFKLPLYRSI